MQKNQTNESCINESQNIDMGCVTILHSESIWLSYIIPLYNCGEYITTCLDSVLAQGLEQNEYEVIVVNDGSTDNGGEIVARYCQKHNNFRLINKENGGVSSARNRGIDEAKGEYVYFMDADDRLLPDGMRTLRDCYLNKYAHADVISFQIQTEDKNYNPQEWEHIRPHKMYFQGSFLEYGNKYGISWSIYSQIISHKLLIDHNIRSKPYTRAQDVMFMLSLFCVTDARIIATDLNIYRYFIREDSAMRRTDNKHIERTFYGFLDMFIELQKMRDVSRYNKTIFEDRMIYCQAEAFVRVCHASFSYTEIKRMLNDAFKKKFYPIEKPISHIHQFINKTYRHPFVVYLFSLLFRYVYVPLIKPLNLHHLYIKYLTSQTK